MKLQCKWQNGKNEVCEGKQKWKIKLLFTVKGKMEKVEFVDDSVQYVKKKQ